MMNTFNLIEDSATYIESSDFFDKIALVAHNCYQVKEKDHDSNVAFISRLINNHHLAMIEHYRFLFKIDKEHYLAFKDLGCPFIKLIKPVNSLTNIYLLSTSLRPLLEGKSEREIALYHYLERALPDEIRTVLFPQLPLGECAVLSRLAEYESLLSPEQYDELAFYTYQLITDRGVTHELVRHRPCSFAQESTRYCNYTKDKFSNTLTFIKPLRYQDFQKTFDDYYQAVTDTYFELINNGAKPEEARAVLPNSLKASIMVSADLTEWKHIFSLRISPFAHPDISRVISKVKGDMEMRGFLR